MGRLGEKKLEASLQCILAQALNSGLMQECLCLHEILHSNVNNSLSTLPSSAAFCRSKNLSERNFSPSFCTHPPQHVDCLWAAGCVANIKDWPSRSAAHEGTIHSERGPNYKLIYISSHKSTDPLRGST